MTKQRYAQIAQHYRRINAGRNDLELIRPWIRTYAQPGAKLLDLGCGDGQAIDAFGDEFESVGIDLSIDMLKVAEPSSRTKLIQGDIRSLPLSAEFNVILMLFDTLNHLLEFEDWERVFKAAAEMLHKEGLFLFDCNSLFKHQYFSETSPYIEHIEEDFIVMRSEETHKGGIEILIEHFQAEGDDTFRRQALELKEQTFEQELIEACLEKYFTKIEVFDEAGERPQSESENFYFLCRGPLRP